MITILHGEDSIASRNAIPKGAIIVDAKSATEEYLAQLSSGGSLFEEKKPIVMWFDHKLSVSQQKNFPGASFQEFKINENVFKFVQSLRPNNHKEVLSQFANYCRQEHIEIVFTMIVRQFRLMLNPNELSSWQKDKIVDQAKFFTKESLKENYKKLLKIDFENKKGLSAMDLKGSLELFLLAL